MIDTAVLTIPNPRSINTITFFLHEALPDNDTAAALYCSSPPFTELQFIGAINNFRPSDIFHTAWALNPAINIHSEIKVAIKIKPTAEVETTAKINQETDLNKEYAKKVAQNLFNYLDSVSKEVE